MARLHQGQAGVVNTRTRCVRRTSPAGAVLTGSPAARRLGPPLLAGQRQVHRLSFGTLASTCWAWAPQPVQVIFLQWSQMAGLHMRVPSFFLCQVPTWRQV